MAEGLSDLTEMGRNNLIDWFVLLENRLSIYQIEWMFDKEINF